MALADRNDEDAHGVVQESYLRALKFSIVFMAKTGVNCQRARELIDPFLDGELDLHQAREIRRHLGECEACNIAHRNLLTLSSTLKENPLYHHAPEGLQKRIQLSLHEESR